MRTSSCAIDNGVAAIACGDGNTPVHPGATTTYSCYDSMGRVTSSSQATGSTAYNFSYTYDLSGALASETYPSGRTITNASFDAAGRVTQVAGDRTNVEPSSVPRRFRA